MRKLIVFLLFACCATFGQQTNSDIIPATSGLNLGRSNQRWNGYLQNLDINGTCTINGSPCLGAGPGGNGIAITNAAGLSTVPGKQNGTIAVITDGLTFSDCTIGGGITNVVCQFNGSTWSQLPVNANFASPPPLGNVTPSTVGATTVTVNGDGLFFQPQSNCIFEGSDPTLHELEDVSGKLMWLYQGLGGPCTQILNYTPPPDGISPTDKQVIAYDAPSGSFTVQNQTGGNPPFSAITSASNTAAAMLVGSGASLGPTGTGTIVGTSDVRPVINVTDPTYGAATSNTAAQNNTAFTAAAAAANAITLATGGGGQATIYIPYGNYSYSGGLVFTQNMVLKCEPGTTLNYTGSAHAADFGPTGLLAWDEKTSFYVIDGCGWTGGASMTEGLFFNKFIGFPRITRNKFYNFGNSTSTVYQMWFDSDNYSTVVDHNFIDNDDSVARSHLKMNNSNGNGNSLLDYHDNYLISISNGSQSGFSSGVGVWADGSQSQIHDNDFNWGAPNIRFGNFCQGCYAHDNYMETLATTAAVEVGAPSTASCPDGITITKSYFNAHSTAWLVGPSASNTGICTNMVVDDITLVGYPAATPLVKVNTGTNLKSNSISNVGGLPSPPVTSGSSDVWQIRYKPGAAGPITGTDVWAVAGISASTVDRLSFNVNGGQPILSINDTNNAITTMAATQSTVGGAAGTFTNHPYAIRTNNADRMTFDTSGNVLLDGPNGSNAQNSYFGCETANAATTLSTVATTTDTGLNCLPINAVIDSVVYRITTTITTAANFTIGDATTAARFCGTQSTLTSGTTGICFVQADQTGASGPRQTAAAKVRVTTNVNPGAGAIRLIVYYHTWTAPTS